MAALVEPEVLDMEYDALVKRAVFASFQALHFSSAAVRARQHAEAKEESTALEISALKAACCKLDGDLDQERVAHAKDLLELERTRAELQIAKGALKTLDKEMIATLDKMALLEKESKDIAMQYTLMARIGMLLETAEQRAAWSLQEEVEAFKLKFPDSSLEEWGVPEAVGVPSVTK